MTDERVVLDQPCPTCGGVLRLDGRKGLWRCDACAGVPLPDWIAADEIAGDPSIREGGADRIADVIRGHLGGAVVPSSGGSVSVKGHTRKDGTQVPAHQRSRPKPRK